MPITPKELHIIGIAPGRTSITVGSSKWSKTFDIIVGPEEIMPAATSSARKRFHVNRRQSITIKLASQPMRVAISDPKVADFDMVKPEELTIRGIAPGETDLTVWLQNKKDPTTYNILVDP